MWQDESGRVHTPLEPVVLAATLLLIPVLILEADAHGGWLTFAYFVNWGIWGVFAAEFALVLYVGKRRRAALRAHWLDLAIVLLTVPIVSAALGWAVSHGSSGSFGSGRLSVGHCRPRGGSPRATRFASPRS
jgi:hypothetical protein